MSFRKDRHRIHSDDSDDDFMRMAYDGGDGDAPAEKGKYDDEVAGFSTGLTDGIQRERSCTDILCLVIFWAFIAGMGFCAIKGSKEGQFDKLIAPLDAAKNFCGIGDYADYPKLLMTDYSSVNMPLSILGTGVCIKECPSDQSMKLEDGKTCKDNAKVKCEAAKSSKTLNNPLNICFPLNRNALSSEGERAGFDALVKAIKTNPAGRTFEDMKASSTAMYMGMGTALFWSVVYIFLMSKFAEPLAWCCVFLVQIGLIAGAVGGYFMWEKAKKAVVFE